jgi:subtilisin family serine protease
MRPRPVYIGVFIAVILGIYEHRYFSEPACAKTRFANQQILLKLKKHHAEGHDVIIGKILPWLVRIDSLSPHDPDGPYLISLPQEVSPEQAISRASSDNRVEYAEPNYPIHAADTVPNDPFFEFMWQLHNKPFNEYVGKQGADVGAVRAWDITTGSRDVVVAILDTGVELTHPDLAANAWINPREVPNNGLDDDKNGLVDDMNGWNFLHDNNQLFEDAEVDYHGTHIAGIIGAVGNNKIGTTGVAWRVSLMALKVLDGHGNKGLIANSVKAINYVISQRRAGANVRVINASWVNEGESRAVRDAIEAAGRAGIVFICAAGNDAKNLDQDPIYPAARSADLDCLISVAATDRFDNLQPFSNYGRKTISVAAPGTDILGLGVGGQYAEHSGTSMATAHVSGIAVLMVAHDPSFTPARIKRRMISTAEPIAGLSASCVGVGRAHAFNALTNTIRVLKIPVIGVVQTIDDTLIVDGLGFVKDLSVIEVNGAALASTTYDSIYVRPTGKLTRLSANLGKEKLERMFKFDVPVQISVYNPATKERSNSFVFVRTSPRAP